MKNQRSAITERESEELNFPPCFEKDREKWLKFTPGATLEFIEDNHDFLLKIAESTECIVFKNGRFNSVGSFIQGEKMAAVFALGCGKLDIKPTIDEWVTVYNGLTHELLKFRIKPQLAAVANG